MRRFGGKLNTRRVAALMLRQFYLARGSPARILPMFAWIAIDIVLWGFITRYLDAVAASGFSFITSLLGAVLLWDFLSRVMQGVSIAFLEDVWSRNFLSLFATPLSVKEYLLGIVGAGIVTSLIGLVAMILIARLAFGLSFAAYGLVVAPGLLVLFIFGISIGVIASGVVLRLGPSAEWLAWPIPAVLSPFASVFYPVSTLPAWMRPLAYIMPPSYVFEALRAVVAGGSPHYDAIALSLVLACLYLLGAGALFHRIYRSCLRSGLIARYTAESV